MSEKVAPLHGPHAGLCAPFLSAMEIIGKRWNGALVQVLRDGPLRFVELKNAVPGISDAVLTTRLGELLQCELVAREPSSRSPYSLTEKGAALLPILDDLTAWSAKWVPQSAHRAS